MSEKHIKRYTLEQALTLKGETNWDKLREMGDFEGPDDEDFEVDWTRAVMVDGLLKKPVSIRLDPDVLAWFKAGGAGYQTRINAVLRAWMEAQKARKPG